jgi:drug/metabolite transporter (DMT)-like permease
MSCLSLTTKAAESNQRQQAAIGYLSVLFASVLFGSVFTLAKIPLERVDPLALAALTYTIAGLSLIPFAKVSFKFGTRRDYHYLLAITLLGAVAAPVLLLYGLQQTSASDASILTNGEVLFTIILSAIFFNEKPKGRVGLFAVVLVIIGLFMATTDLRPETVLSFNAGNVMILASMFCWAVDNNLSRRLTANVNPAKIAMVKSLLGGLILLAIALALGRWDYIAAIDNNRHVRLWVWRCSPALFAGHQEDWDCQNDVCLFARPGIWHSNRGPCPWRVNKHLSGNCDWHHNRWHPDAEPALELEQLQIVCHPVYNVRRGWTYPYAGDRPRRDLREPAVLNLHDWQREALGALAFFPSSSGRPSRRRGPPVRLSCPCPCQDPA